MHGRELGVAHRGNGATLGGLGDVVRRRLTYSRPQPRLVAIRTVYRPFQELHSRPPSDAICPTVNDGVAAEIVTV